MSAVQIIFHGRVQGVGFRALVKRMAQKFALTGTVRNCAEGTVEAWVQGEQELIDSFLDALRDAEGAHRLDAVVTEMSADNGVYSTFEIIA